MELYILEATLRKYIKNMYANISSAIGPPSDANSSAQDPPNDGPLIHKYHKVNHDTKAHTNERIIRLTKKEEGVSSTQMNLNMWAHILI